MVLLGLICAQAAQPHYGRVQFELLPDTIDTGPLIRSVREAAQSRGVRLEVSGAPSIDALDADVLKVLRVTLESDSFRGAELDLFTGPKGKRVPVTVRWEAEVLSVERGDTWQPSWHRTSRGIVRGRYGLEAVEDGTRAWNRPLLAMVERAFERLSEPERKVLEGLTLRADERYEPLPGQPHIDFLPGAMYRADLHQIQVFDASLGPSFVGPVEDPEPAGVFMLLHEIAHVLDTRSEGELSERFQREVPGVSVTTYGSTSPQEAFAEAFALWRTDRPALERISPVAAEFFDRDRHL